MKLNLQSIRNRLKSNILDLKKKIEFNHQLDYPKHPLYLCDNIRITSCQKEPDTIKWIETFDKNDVAFDVGANVGAYSLVMSLYAKKVFAFEPSVTTFGLLCKNILTNVQRQTIKNEIVPLNIALSDQTKLETFNYEGTRPGQSDHQLGRTVDCQGKTFNPKFSQQLLSITIDQFVEIFKIDPPNHIKIDVDGIELAVLKGANKTLSHPNVKSILVENNDNESNKDEVINYLLAHKFVVKDKFNLIPGQRFYNYLFTR
jgi:FkbM family methyltransferase